jgi:carbamoyltransferase
LGSPPSAARQIIVGHANGWHDPAIAVLDGDQLFAESLERHTRCARAVDMPRLWYSWPALRAFLLANGAFPVRDASVSTVSTWSRISALEGARSLGDPSADPFAALTHAAVLLEPLADNQLAWMLRGHPPRPFAPSLTEDAGVPDGGRTTWQSTTLMHQLAHAANAVYTSPFEECAVMVMDGVGDGTAISFYFFRDGEFILVNQVRPQVSLGLLYGLVTQLCGFDPYQNEEWKVMALAAFGQYRDDVYHFFRDRIAVNGLDVDFRPAGRSAAAFDVRAWSELEGVVGGFRRPQDPDVLRAADLAHNFQKAWADVVLDLASNFGRLGISPNLAFGGGCALNASACGRIVPHAGFERLFVPSAPGADGNALGAVLFELYHERKVPRHGTVLTPYLGSSMDMARLEEILAFGAIRHHKVADEEALCEEAAGLLADGKTVAWVQGSAEFGGQALGNRSVLADPRPPGMKERLRARVGGGEFYVPLGAAILAEHAADYFHDCQPSPYMERALRVRDEVKARVPAIVHEDGTARLHSVTEEGNPLYHRLLERFRARTGVPLLACAALSPAGQPLVHSVEDAIATFYTGGLDRLVIGRYVLEH